MVRDVLYVEGETEHPGEGSGDGPGDGRNARSVDLCDAPLETVAAFWLSLAKIGADRKKGMALLAQEAESVREPLLAYLLGLVVDKVDEERLRHLAGVRRQRVLTGYRRAFACMRLTAVAAAGSDRPRQTLISMLAMYPVRPLPESRVAHLGKELYAAVVGREEGAMGHLAVGSGDKPEHLLVKLLTWLLIARKDGADAVRELAPVCPALLFSEGMSLAADGFSPAFLDRHLADLTGEMFEDIAAKVTLCEDMAAGLAAGADYDHLYRLGQAHLL